MIILFVIILNILNKQPQTQWTQGQKPNVYSQVINVYSQVINVYSQVINVYSQVINVYTIEHSIHTVEIKPSRLDRREVVVGQRFDHSL